MATLLRTYSTSTASNVRLAAALLGPDSFLSQLHHSGGRDIDVELLLISQSKDNICLRSLFHEHPKL